MISKMNRNEHQFDKSREYSQCLRQLYRGVTKKKSERRDTIEVMGPRTGIDCRSNALDHLLLVSLILFTLDVPQCDGGERRDSGAVVHRVFDKVEGGRAVMVDEGTPFTGFTLESCARDPFGDVLHCQVVQA